VKQSDIISTFLRFNPSKIILFGSSALGTGEAWSDIDLIVIYNTSKRFLDRLEELYLSWPFPQAVDILPYTPEEFEEMLEETFFLQDVVSSGKVIYENPA